MNLIEKYNVPGPRYTSYPTVPYWDEEQFTTAEWDKKFSQTIMAQDANAQISLYIHLPFCESLCTFCACNKHITRNHSVEKKYIAYLLKEWRQIISRMASPPVIKELHLGGGTPTFFSAENLGDLINSIFADALRPQEYSYSFEGHPNSTTGDHLQTLIALGFDRVSFGVQDYAENVQKAINRRQPFERVKKITGLSRELGYTSVTHDLIYGLPFQTIASNNETMARTVQLRPDRIAFYSYAHVPWIKGSGQRAYQESDLPDSVLKRRLYENGRQALLQAGYVEIGMDHFALPNDRLFKAMEQGHLHRNFMGYTENHTNVLIGLGVSAISDCWSAFSQNVKTVREYFQCLDNGTSPAFRGHILNEEDLILRKHILNLMCNFSTQWQPADKSFRPLIIENLEEFEKDGLVSLSADHVSVTDPGRAFVRNICMAFDLRMKRHDSEIKLFSMTV